MTALWLLDVAVLALAVILGYRLRIRHEQRAADAWIRNARPTRPTNEAGHTAPRTAPRRPDVRFPTPPDRGGLP